MNDLSQITRQISAGFDAGSQAMVAFGMKLAGGGAHSGKTMMLAELETLLVALPNGASASDYRMAIVEQNVLGKATESTRHESLRRLHSLYALDENTPIFRLLRHLVAIDIASLSLLALQVAWARDPLFRVTTPPVLEAAVGETVATYALEQALEAAFPKRYSANSRLSMAQNAASSWTQSGHLVGHTNKTRRWVKPSSVAVTMALFLGDVAGYHGAAVFANPWCRLLDLNPERAKELGFEAHRASLLTLRAVGEVIELSFPALADVQGGPG